MRPQEIIVGIMLVLFAIPSYFYFPSFISDEMNKLTETNTPSPMAVQILSTLHIPSTETMVKLTQYSSIATGVAGLGFIAFGAIAKKKARPEVQYEALFDLIKILKELAAKMSKGTPQGFQGEKNVSLRAIHLLQERLVQGEITSFQFESLKKLLESNTQ